MTAAERPARVSRRGFLRVSATLAVLPSTVLPAFAMDTLASPPAVAAVNPSAPRPAPCHVWDDIDPTDF